MKPICAALALAGFLTALAFPANSKAPFEGRWDLTIVTPKGTYPSWLEVKGNDVRLVGRVSSVHSAKDVKIDGSRLTFSSSEWFGKPINVDWEFQAARGKLTGTQKRADGVEGKIAGVPAPLLNREMPSKWSKPKPIFNGKDLTGWEPDDASKNNWKAENGELVDGSPGANLRTTGKFQDFKLHIEYNCPDKGNSGVYLRGRYEVQVEYEPPGTDDKFHSMGAIYGFLAPSVEIPRRPGNWETYDVTLVGRTVTVVRDGIKTIDSQEIPGITGGAIDSHEAKPGVIYLQGDHTGNMRFRNITISVPAK